MLSVANYNCGMWLSVTRLRVNTECGFSDWPNMKTTIIKATLHRMWRFHHSRSLRSPTRSFNVRIDVHVDHLLLQLCTIHAMLAASLITIQLIQLNKLKNSYNSRINHNKIFRLTLSLEFKWYVFYSEGIFPMLSIVFADQLPFSICQYSQKRIIHTILIGGAEAEYKNHFVFRNFCFFYSEQPATSS